MKILIDVGHPAQVHYYSALYKFLKDDHSFIFTCRDQQIVADLLKYYGIPYIVIGEKGTGLKQKALKQLNFTKTLHNLIKSHEIDLAFGVSSVLASKGSKAKSIVFCDDDREAIKLISKTILPFADTIISPDSLSHEGSPKTVYYPGSHELSYLHPNRYQPDPVVLQNYGLREEEVYFILRLTAFKAYHDHGNHGLTTVQKKDLVERLSQYGRVYITSETPIDGEFEKYRIPVKVHEMHSFLAYASMLVSDSQTMTSEAAVLGVPSFRCNTFAGRLSVLEEEEKRYGLTVGFKPWQFNWMIDAITKHLQRRADRTEWYMKRDMFIRDKIDVTPFWASLINDYPKSIDKLLKT
ncbi:MAG: DUF354 domain-containing protein [Candidatus Cloacimonadaceae bacterium]|nr:DUF354 domain-containing protein [Candidatus Cloacimonadaceae bacterium]